ncbi:MAG TPA: energy transducer TonB [Tepidisphaeraceae bacterium]|jgi:TonB family protein|nr:energy transducer TonB [Tepidisphaeraceae bacterium]
MRHRDVTFIIAIAASLAVHLLMIPAGKHITIRGGSGGSDDGRGVQVTILLSPSDDAKENDPEKTKPPVPAPAPPLPAPPTPVVVAPPPPKPSVKPKPPEADPEEEMGDANGKGIGSNAAKGDQPLVAKQADEEQAFLSRDPVGPGHVGELPSDWTGPRGEGGTGGQRGGPAVAVAPMQVKPVQPQTIEQQPPKETADPSPADPQPPRARELKVTEGPEPALPAIAEKPQADAPEVALPTPSLTASQGAAPADLTKKPADEVLATGPLAGPADGVNGPVALMPKEGAFALPVKATSTAPPMPEASPHKSAVVIAPQLPPQVAAQVSLPQAPTIDEAKIAPKPQDVARPHAEVADKPSKPAAPVQVAMANPPVTQAPPRVATGDGRAPGVAKPQADPAQESDSESDPFQKAITADLLRDGKLEIRKGRKIKTTRPHILLGGQVSLYAMANAAVVLKISIDETGKVTGADIIQSSGSADVDQPCRVAVYDWWIEPTHDKSGKPVPDVLVFTIRFR